ncbi:VirK/YbjX family protein [Aeromonas sp. AE23HZ002T15]
MTTKSIDWDHLSRQGHFCAQKMARYLYPEESARKTFNRAKFVLRSLLYRTQLSRVYELFLTEPLRALPAHYPELLDKPMRPYRFACSTVNQRTEMVETHYRLLLARYPALIEQLYLGAGIELGRFPQHDYRIVLRHDGTFRREAELALSIVNERGERLYSCAFSLAGSDAELAVVIGSVQGPEPCVHQPQEQVRALTKAGHGLRPKSLVVIMVLALGQAMGASRVTAVRMKAHIYQARRYSKRKKACLQADYDELWQEFGAVDQDENFVRLQPAGRTPLEEVATKKRAMYRRRYQWLDELALACQQALARD